MTILKGSEAIHEIVGTNQMRQRNTPDTNTTYTRMRRMGSLICVPSRSMMLRKKYPSKRHVAEPHNTKVGNSRRPRIYGPVGVILVPPSGRYIQNQGTHPRVDHPWVCRTKPPRSLGISQICGMKSR